MRAWCGNIIKYESEFTPQKKNNDIGISFRNNGSKIYVNSKEDQLLDSVPSPLI